MVAGTAVMGKHGLESGDSLEGFDPDPPLATIRARLRGTEFDPHDLLQQATTRLVYDLFAYQDSQHTQDLQPVSVYTIARETHEADLRPGNQTALQQSWTYSDGFGREIQTKVQAEPGPVPAATPPAASSSVPARHAAGRAPGPLGL